MTNKPEPPRKCRTCGAELMDCVMTNECDFCFDKRTAPKPEPPRETLCPGCKQPILVNQRMYRDEIGRKVWHPKCWHEAWTPETPSGPRCPTCASEIKRVRKPVLYENHSTSSSDFWMARHCTDSWHGNCPACGCIHQSLPMTLDYHLQSCLDCLNPWHKGETPSAPLCPKCGRTEARFMRSGRAYMCRDLFHDTPAPTPEPHKDHEDEPPYECIVCGARLLPIETPPHCEDCVVTDEHYEKWEAGTPEPRPYLSQKPGLGKEMEDQRKDPTRGAWTAGTPVEARSAAPETPSAPTLPELLNRIKHHAQGEAVPGETPSALSAPQFDEWQIEHLAAENATLREEIEDLRGMVRDERALRKGQLEEIQEKLATAEREIVDLKDSLHETEEAWRVRAELQKAAEAELARVKEALQRCIDVVRMAKTFASPQWRKNAEEVARRAEAALRPGGEKPKS